MKQAEFDRLFKPEQEIGRIEADAQLVIYRDNGHRVGVWREHRASASGHGEVLGFDEAATARQWFANRTNP